MDIQRRSIEDVTLCCQEERQAFRLTGERSSPCCTELFRRAFNHDQDAWAVIDSMFHPLIQHWLQTISVRYPDLFSAEDHADLAQIAKQAFTTHAGKSLTPLAVDDLDRILAYWRTCARNAVLQEIRRHPIHLLTDSLGERPIPALSHDPTLRIALQQRIPSLLHTDDERLIFDRCFVQGFPPRDIAERFTNEAAVYQMLQKLRRRFRSDPIMRALAGLDPRDDSSESFSAEDSGKTVTNSLAPDQGTSRRRKPHGPTSLEIRAEDLEKAELPMEVPCQFDESMLLDYIANLLSAEQRLAVEANPACLVRAQRLAAEIAQIEALLYRATCPAVEQLTAYYDRQIDGTQSLVIMRHVEHCDRCSEELAMLAVMDAIPLESPGPLSHLRRIVEAVLQPALAFQLRGQAYIYSAPHVLITLSLRQNAGAAPRWMLTGELSDGDGLPFADTIDDVVAYRNDEPGRVAEIESDGAFILRMLPSGNYRLVIRTHEAEIIIRSLSIGSNDADE